MNLWEHTGEELIGGAEITSDVILAPEIEMPWESDKVERIISMPNYATAPAIGHRGLADQVLLERDGDGWKCVGHYVDDTIIVFRRVQNTGLADILFLRCMEHRNKLPITTALNENALRLFKRVRKREVEKAKGERDATCLKGFWKSSLTLRTVTEHSLCCALRKDPRIAASDPDCVKTRTSARRSDSLPSIHGVIGYKIGFRIG